MESDKDQELNPSTPLSETQLKAVMKQGYVPGMSVAFIIDGKIVQAFSLGVTSTDTKTPPSDETRFWACSLSKPVFAYLVTKLIENSTLPKNFLDLPLSEYLKSLSLDLEYDQHFSQDAPVKWKEALTARMILNHQTGLPNWAERGTGDGVLNFKTKPGYEFTYSGEGFLYLQKVIEKVTKKSLNELAKENIFNPLKMNHSSFAYPDDTQAVTNYHDEAMAPIASAKNYGNDNNAAGSLHTTASDYALFLLACLNDKNFLEIEKNLQDPIKDKEAVKKELDENALNHVYWYLGFGIQKINDEVILFHWGHGNGARAFFAMNMKSKSALVFFTNSDNGLSLTHYLVTQTVGNLQYGLNWLFTKEDYKDLTAPGWEKYHTALMLEAEGNYQSALALFKELKNLLPKDKLIVNRIEWLEILNQLSISPVTINSERLKQYEGEYGPLKLVLNGSELQIEEGGRTHKLTPVDDKTFLDKDGKVRITFDRDKSNIPTLTCRFLDGKTFTFTYSKPEVTKTEETSETRPLLSTSRVALKLEMDLSEKISPDMPTQTPLPQTQDKQQDSTTSEMDPSETFKPKP